MRLNFECKVTTVPASPQSHQWGIPHTTNEVFYEIPECKKIGASHIFSLTFFIGKGDTVFARTQSFPTVYMPSTSSLSVEFVMLWRRFTSKFSREFGGLKAGNWQKSGG